METTEKICPKCNKIVKRITRGVCHNCYRKFLWKKELIKCKRCNRMKPNHAWGFCIGCYTSVFHIERANEDASTLIARNKMIGRARGMLEDRVDIIYKAIRHL